METKQSIGDISGQSETFSDYKRMKKERWIVEKTDEFFSDNPFKTSEDAAEYLNSTFGTDISAKTVTRAFEKEQERENPLLKFGKKAGLGVLGLGILNRIDTVQEVSGDFVENLLNNKVATGLTVGLASFWQGFVVPRIERPENELSELEVFTRLMNSNVGQVTIGALISAITLPGLLDWIKTQVLDRGFAIAANWNDSIKDAVQQAKDNVSEAVESTKDQFEEFGQSVGVNVGDEGDILFSDSGQELEILDIRIPGVQKWLAPAGFKDQTFGFTASGQSFPSYDEWYDAKPGLYRTTNQKIDADVKNAYAIDRNNFIREFGLTREEFEELIEERQRGTGTGGPRVR